jgi:hypothetical protein
LTSYRLANQTRSSRTASANGAQPLSIASAYHFCVELFDRGKAEIKSDQLGQKFVDEFQHNTHISSKPDNADGCYSGGNNAVARKPEKVFHS